MNRIEPASGKPITGKTVLIYALSAFAVIIAANLALAFAAIGSFPGIEVKNGYVASQSFERERAAQVALGWKANAVYSSEKLRVEVIDRHGSPAPLSAFTLKIGRPTTEALDATPDLVWTGVAHEAAIDLDAGLWRVDVLATGRDGEAFRQQLIIKVKRAGASG